MSPHLKNIDGFVLLTGTVALQMRTFRAGASRSSCVLWNASMRTWLKVLDRLELYNKHPRVCTYSLSENCLHFLTFLTRAINVRTHRHLITVVAGLWVNFRHQKGALCAVRYLSHSWRSPESAKLAPETPLCGLMPTLSRHRCSRRGSVIKCWTVDSTPGARARDKTGAIPSWPVHWHHPLLRVLRILRTARAHLTKEEGTDVQTERP